MSPVQAIEATTRVAAEACGVAPLVGTLEAGKEADLLVVADYDPAWPALIASIASALISWRVGKRPGTLSTLDTVTDKPDAL